MPWHQPKTWRPGDIRLTAAILNYELRDELIYLYDTLTAHIGATATWIDVDGGIGFDDNWVNFSGAAMPAGYIIEDNWVSLRGLVRDGTGNVLFTLPSGYRPPYGVRFPVTDTSSVVGMLTITSGGQVTANSSALSAGVIDLSPIRFRVI